jgi:hypothetical protein
MDLLGCQWCRDNTEQIVGWLKEEATRRKAFFSETVARRLVRLAVWQAERECA